jgi:hypothetical protein
MQKFDRLFTEVENISNCYNKFYLTTCIVTFQKNIIVLIGLNPRLTL